MHGVIHVVPIVGVINVHIVGFVPGSRPHLRPRIDKCDPISVVLEAGSAAYENQRKTADAEGVAASEVTSEAGVRNPVAVVSAALTPRSVFGIPRTSARLDETAAHLSLVLWDTAMVSAAIGWTVRLHAAMIGATGTLYWPLSRTARLLISFRFFSGILIGMRLRAPEPCPMELNSMGKPEVVIPFLATI